MGKSHDFSSKDIMFVFFSSIKGFQNYNEYLYKKKYTIIKGKGKFTYKIMKGKL